MARKVYTQKREQVEGAGESGLGGEFSVIRKGERGSAAKKMAEAGH